MPLTAFKLFILDGVGFELLNSPSSGGDSKTICENDVFYTVIDYWSGVSMEPKSPRFFF